MFRPIPETTLFRKVPYRLVASVLLVFALVVSVILLFSLERKTLLLRGFIEGENIPTELVHALWQSRSDLIVETLLIFFVSSIGIAAVITFLHYDAARKTLEEVKGLARNILHSIPMGVLTINQGGSISAMNPIAEAVLNRASSELLGISYDVVFPKEDPIRRILDEALKEHRHVNQKDFLYECGDLSPRTIRVSTADLTGDDKKPTGVILQAQDVLRMVRTRTTSPYRRKVSGVAHPICGGSARAAKPLERHGSEPPSSGRRT